MQVHSLHLSVRQLVAFFVWWNIPSFMRTYTFCCVCYTKPLGSLAIHGFENTKITCFTFWISHNYIPARFYYGRLRFKLRRSFITCIWQRPLHSLFKWICTEPAFPFYRWTRPSEHCAMVCSWPHQQSMLARDFWRYQSLFVSVQLRTKGWAPCRNQLPCARVDYKISALHHSNLKNSLGKFWINLKNAALWWHSLKTATNATRVSSITVGTQSITRFIQLCMIQN